MEYVGEWREMRRRCTHCGKTLEGRPNWKGHNFFLSGFEPMEFRHKETATKECWIRREAQPYDTCRAYEEWKESHHADED